MLSTHNSQKFSILIIYSPQDFTEVSQIFAYYLKFKDAETNAQLTTVTKRITISYNDRNFLSQWFAKYFEWKTLVHKIGTFNISQLNGNLGAQKCWFITAVFFFTEPSSSQCQQGQRGEHCRRARGHPETGLDFRPAPKIDTLKLG